MISLNTDCLQKCEYRPYTSERHETLGPLLSAMLLVLKKVSQYNSTASDIDTINDLFVVIVKIVEIENLLLVSNFQCYSVVYSQFTYA